MPSYGGNKLLMVNDADFIRGISQAVMRFDGKFSGETVFIWFLTGDGSGGNRKTKKWWPAEYRHGPPGVDITTKYHPDIFGYSTLHCIIVARRRTSSGRTIRSDTTQKVIRTASTTSIEAVRTGLIVRVHEIERNSADGTTVLYTTTVNEAQPTCLYSSTVLERPAQ